MATLLATMGLTGLAFVALRRNATARAHPNMCAHPLAVADDNAAPGTRPQLARPAPPPPPASAIACALHSPSKPTLF